MAAPLPLPTGRPRRAGDPPQRPIAAALSLPSEHVSTIADSHERCAALGLSRIGQPDLSPLPRPDLLLARERNQRLHAHAAPVMEMLHEQIVHTQSMVVLCDATGTIIHSIGDDDFLDRARKVALAPGVNWSEQAKGTNAIGTALVAETPTLVHADEHFMHANHFLTCSAAPILDPRGNILGVLDVTGDQRSYHQHTMALVRMSARMIENHWLTDDFRHVMRLHFHDRVEFIGTLMEGILAVTEDGRIVGANRSALDQLAMSGAALRMQSLGGLFGTGASALIDHFRSPLAAPLSVRAPTGRQFSLVARYNGPAWHVAPAPKAQPAVAPSPPPPDDRISLAQLTTGDAQWAAIAAKARRVLDRDIPILLLGDTGTGKALLARALHHESQRARQPFVAVPCSSIAPALLEAELFGADGGRLAQARGGTLYLDEIAALPPAVQARLLRALQDGPGVTLICATRRNPRELIAAQTLREDLYYRLNGLTLRVPALRERTDVLLLANRIVEREAGPRPLALAPEVTALLARHPWPGNVRQLFNVLRAACVMAGGERTIRREHLPDDFFDELAEPAPVVAAPVAPVAAEPPPERSLDEIERAAIARVLDAAGGNISEAAKRLGISRNTIYRKLRWSSARV